MVRSLVGKKERREERRRRLVVLMASVIECLISLNFGCSLVVKLFQAFLAGESFFSRLQRDMKMMGVCWIIVWWRENKSFDDLNLIMKSLIIYGERVFLICLRR